MKDIIHDQHQVFALLVLPVRTLDMSELRAHYPNIFLNTIQSQRNSRQIRKINAHIMAQFIIKNIYYTKCLTAYHKHCAPKQMQIQSFLCKIYKMKRF